MSDKSSAPGRKCCTGRTNPKRGEAAIRGFDPFDYLLTKAINSKGEDERERLALELLPYCKPKLKALEMKGDMKSPSRSPSAVLTEQGAGDGPQAPAEPPASAFGTCWQDREDEAVRLGDVGLVARARANAYGLTSSANRKAGYHR